MDTKQTYQLLATEEYDDFQPFLNKEDIEMDYMESSTINDKLLKRKTYINSSTAPEFSKKLYCISLLGLLYAFFSCCFFATGSLFTKLCQGFLTAFQVTLIRCLMQLIFCISIIAHNRLTVWKSFSFQTRIFLAIRGVFGGGALMLIFYSFQNMPLGDASAIVFSSSVYTVLLARVFLKEPFGFLDGIILIVTVFGVILITRPTTIFSPQQTENEPITINTTVTTFFTPTMINSDAKLSNVFLGTVSAIAASLMISCGHIALRNLSSIHFSIPLFYLSVCGVIVTSASMLITRTFLLPSELKFWGYAILVGVCGCIGQIFMTKAYQLEKAGPVAIIRQCDIVLAYVFQLTVFMEPPLITSSIGAILIIGGSLSLALKKLLTTAKS